MTSDLTREACEALVAERRHRLRKLLVEIDQYRRSHFGQLAGCDGSCRIGKCPNALECATGRERRQLWRLIFAH